MSLFQADFPILDKVLDIATREALVVKDSTGELLDSDAIASLRAKIQAVVSGTSTDIELPSVATAELIDIASLYKALCDEKTSGLYALSSQDQEEIRTSVERLQTFVDMSLAQPRQY